MLSHVVAMSQVAHTCAWLLGCLAQSWGGAHQFRVPSASSYVGYTAPVARVTCRPYASNWSEESSVQGPTDETLARGSSESPCRAVRLVNFPRDGHAPGVCATGSDVFPPRSSGTARSGIDEAMGPWLCPQEGDVLLLAQQTVHMDPECLLITRRTYPLQMCYCVTKLHRCFHYDVDSVCFFLIAGCNGSLGYWQSLATRE